MHGNMRINQNNIIGARAYGYESSVSLDSPSKFRQTKPRNFFFDYLAENYPGLKYLL